MKAGYSSRCKACNSPLRTQIEQWHQKDGLSSRIISAKLAALGEKISDRALDNHFDEHYNVGEVAADQYAESQANLQEDVGKRISEIQVLDDVVARTHRLHKTLEGLLSRRLDGMRDAEKGMMNEALPELPKLPMAYVSLYMGCATGICQALKTKQELLGEDSGKKKADAMRSWVDLMMEDEDEITADKGAEKADMQKGS